MSPELRLLVAWVIALGLTYWLTPRMIRVAEAANVVDVPRGRHAHARTTPLLGGIAIFIGVMVPAMALSPNLALGVTLPLAFAAGLIDDYYKCRGKDMGAAFKLALQLLPAVVLVLMGHTVDHLSNPFGPSMLILPWWLNYPLTLFWLVGMTNAVNFLDGMDGLVTGLVAIAAFTLLIIALVKGALPVAIWVGATLGACLGFLRFNFHPARIFMGDAGSNFLGFLLAAIAVTGYFKAATVVGLAAPLLALAVPVLNAVFVVVRRLVQGKNLVQAFTMGDLEHSFNVLNRLAGFNPMETVLVFLLGAMVISASALGIALSLK